MPTYDRFDICEAYLAVEQDWNSGGWLRERPSNARRMESTDVQLHRIGFKPGAAWNGWVSLSENGREIYDMLCERWHLGDGGYKPCSCRDCMEMAIGWGAPMCSACVEAGCEPERECKAPGAYGGTDEEG